MGAAPIDPLAARTSLEMGLGLADVGGNLAPNSCLVHTLKKRVALQTAGQQSIQVNLVADSFEDFPAARTTPPARSGGSHAVGTAG